MIKQLVVGTAIGRVAMRARDFVEVCQALYSSPESAGTVLNDQAATRLVAGLSRPGTSFIDVGAHIGSVISAVYDHDKTISVIAVEAIPEKVERLRHKFPKAQVYGCAVGESEGEVSFFVDLKQSGYSSLGHRAGDARPGIARITVPMRRLNSLVTASDVDVIKIDVEGAELGVLRGGGAVVDRCRPVIMFESAPPQDDGLGYSKPAMWDWLTEHGYEVLVPNRVAHDGPGLSRDSFVESHFYPRRTTNYFAIPAERRVEIRDRARKLLKMG
jgi:FkbM family methyltransferase